MNKFYYSLSVITLVVLTIVLRLYKITGPVADWHSFRQADTASVARDFEKFGFDIIHPRYDDLSNIQSGKDNPMGWRMVEVPIYQCMAALGHRYIGMVSIEVWLRFISILASVGTVIWILYLVSQTVSPRAGLLAGIFYAVLPYSVYYGRAILPESFGVFFGITSVGLGYLFAMANTKQKSWFFILLSAVSASVALLVKPTTGFLLLFLLA